MINQSEALSNGEVIVVQREHNLPATVGNMISWLMFGSLHNQQIPCLQKNDSPQRKGQLKLKSVVYSEKK